MRCSFDIRSRLKILMGVLFMFRPVPAALAQDLSVELPVIDNTALIPPICPSSRVKMEGPSPNWVKTLIMAQFRIETATPEGTFAAAVRVLDHYAEMGVNGLWINPVYERGSKDNGYGNYGPHTIEPLLTGKTTLRGSYTEIRSFVEEAHKRNIRVIFDIVVWGTSKSSPLVKQHPEFYRRDKTGFWEVWGGYGFNWNSEALRSWFKTAAVTFIEQTGADGFRVDLAPDCSGYFFKEIRDELYRRGRKIIVVSEIASERRDTFDFEQIGVSGWAEKPDYQDQEHLKEQKKQFGEYCDYLFRTNLVDVIKTGTGIGDAALQQKGLRGTYRFYTVNFLCHDAPRPFVKGSRVRFGYLVLSPFIPMWWIGEEWNNPRELAGRNTGVMYYNEINWVAKDDPANRGFFEDVKKYIRIRRSYPDIFEYFPGSAREANIVKLAATRNGEPNSLQAYVRYRPGKAVLVVPNYGSAAPQATFCIKPDFAALEFSEKTQFKLTDLLTGEIIARNSVAEFKQFEPIIKAEHLGIYLLEQE